MEIWSLPEMVWEVAQRLDLASRRAMALVTKPWCQWLYSHPREKTSWDTIGRLTAEEGHTSLFLYWIKHEYVDPATVFQEVHPKLQCRWFYALMATAVRAQNISVPLYWSIAEGFRVFTDTRDHDKHFNRGMRRLLVSALLEVASMQVLLRAQRFLIEFGAREPLLAGYLLYVAMKRGYGCISSLRRSSA